MMVEMTVTIQSETLPAAGLTGKPQSEKVVMGHYLFGEGDGLTASSGTGAGALLRRLCWALRG
jgi:hypothetical protein